jgi:tetratricopeptide (TPR) repeat protein
LPPFQRDGVEDPDDWLDEVGKLRSELHVATPQDRLRILGRLGDLLRAHRDLDNAVNLLEEAVELAREHADELAERANRIRLSAALMYREEHAPASAMLVDLVSHIEASVDRTYLDFAVQHLGKVYAEQEAWRPAVTCFERACSLRSGKPELLASSQRALNEARRSLQVSDVQAK